MNKMIFIASVLDPRNKLDYVPFAIVDMFGEGTRKNLIGEVNAYMRSLFDYYVKKGSKGSLFAPSSPTSCSDSLSTSSVSGYGNFQKRGTMRMKQQLERQKEASGGINSKS